MRVLLLPVDQLTSEERTDKHMTNKFHLRMEPGRVANRR